MNKKGLYYDPVWFAKLSLGLQKELTTVRGKTFAFKFLFKHGDHLFVIGNTGSGKTQKLYWLVNIVRHTRETVIWLDSAKNREIVPLLTMGTPVRVIVPKGAMVEFQERMPLIIKYGPCVGEAITQIHYIKKELEKEPREDPCYEWVRMKNHPEVIAVPDAGSAWWAIKKGMINIFAFRNAFEHEPARQEWMKELFETLSVWTRRNRMPHIYPFAFFGDESHWFVAGQKITSSTDRNLLAELVTEHALTIRAPGGRLVLTGQSYKNLPPAARENLPNTLLCRGAKVAPEENNALSPYNQFTSRYQPKQGLFVYSDGYTYPHDFPWPFPFFEMPKIKVSYSGEFDNPTEKMVIQKEIEQEITPDLSKYNSICQDLIGYEIPANINRYEALPDAT